MSTGADTAVAPEAGNSAQVARDGRLGVCMPIGDILNRGKRRRLNALVRRGSSNKDSLRGFFKTFNPRDRGQILKAAERFDNLTKPRGRRNGALGYTGIKVLKALLEFIDYRSGRLEPSYIAICKRARLSVSAVADALKRLIMHGFVEMRRRYEDTGNTDGGPPVRQITNAYRVMLPPLAARTLRAPPQAPVSDDELERRKVQREQRERMICQLPEWEQPAVRANVADPDLAAVLNSLGRAVFEAENANG